MSGQELMKPRYKVVAGYPGSEYKVGDILTFIREVAQSYDHWKLSRTGETVSYNYFHLYPAIFHPLKWWEERTKEEMPEYLKHMGRVVKPDYYPHAPYLFDLGPEQCMVDYWEIATEEEYLASLNS